MNSIFEQMLSDYKHYIKEERWDEFVQQRIWDVEECGEYVNILDVWDGEDLIERIYQKEHNLGTPYGFGLIGCRASKDGTLNKLLEATP